MLSFPYLRPSPHMGLTTTLSVLGLALLFPVSPASAQDRYVDQVQGYLDLAQETVLNEGFTYEGESSGWMAAGAEAGLVLALSAGDYVVVGQCDDDCTDLDLGVDQLDGTSLGSDRELDSSPVVLYSLTEVTKVIVTLGMIDCATTRCYAGFRWYHRGEAASTAADLASTGAGAGVIPVLGDAGDHDPGSWQEQVLAQLEVIPTDGMTLVKDRLELLNADARTSFSLSLDAGRYLGVAACDNDCLDLDMAVADGTGEVDSDVLIDAHPIVEFEVTDRNRYTFEVRMVDCSTARCGYGLRLYRVD